MPKLKTLISSIFSITLLCSLSFIFLSCGDGDSGKVTIEQVLLDPNPIPLAGRTRLSVDFSYLSEFSAEKYISFSIQIRLPQGVELVAGSSEILAIGGKHNQVEPSSISCVNTGVGSILAFILGPKDVGGALEPSSRGDATLELSLTGLNSTAGADMLLRADVDVPDYGCSLNFDEELIFDITVE